MAIELAEIPGPLSTVPCADSQSKHRFSIHAFDMKSMVCLANASDLFKAIV